jgi:hypothetical protein
MAHYALIEDGVVTNVIVAEQDFIDTQSGTWVQTSYNTQAGVHTLGGTPLRTCLWEAPVAHPNDGLDYTWDEATLTWVEITE